MQKLIKVSALFFVYFIFGIIEGCTFDDCSGSGDPSKYQVTMLNSFPVQLRENQKNEGFQVDFSEYTDAMASETLAYQQFGIVVSPMFEIVSTHSYSTNLFSSTFACSPPEISFPSITSIRVEALSGYNTDFAPDENLNDIVWVSDNPSLSARTIDSFLGYGEGKKIYGTPIYLYLNRPPMDTTALKLEISITINEETTFTNIIDGIVITP